VNLPFTRPLRSFFFEPGTQDSSSTRIRQGINRHCVPRLGRHKQERIKAGGDGGCFLAVTFIDSSEEGEGKLNTFPHKKYKEIPRD